MSIGMMVSINQRLDAETINLVAEEFGYQTEYVSAEVSQAITEEVDAEGPHCENGRVRYAAKTYENLAAMTDAGLNGVTMPRRYGGLNLPVTVYTAANEMVSTADAGFENIWSLQDCIETLYEFGDEDQRQRFIPRVCKGETMSMDLTEPDAGSDLQSVMLRATWSEERGCWLLNGVKRFITNGDADIHLVLARSEEGTRQRYHCSLNRQIAAGTWL